MPGSDSQNDRDECSQFDVNPRRIARNLTMVVLLLSTIGTIANVCIYHVAPHPEHKIARLMRRFDLGHEPSLPAWYSSIALLTCALLLCAIATMNKRSGRRDTVHWYSLAVIFVMLAVDEAVMFHEMLHNVMHQFAQFRGVFFFPWVIPGLAFVMIVAATFVRFLWRIEARTRWLFIASAAVFVSGAIGMELVAGVVVERYGVASLYHTASQTIEETLEMLGVVIFLYALLSYFQRHYGARAFNIFPDHREIV